MKEKQAELEGLKNLEKCYLDVLKSHHKEAEYWQNALSNIVEAQNKKRKEIIRDVVELLTHHEKQALMLVHHIACIHFHKHVEDGGCLMGHTETGAYSLLQIAEEFIKELQDKEEKKQC